MTDWRPTPGGGWTNIPPDEYRRILMGFNLTNIRAKTPEWFDARAKNFSGTDFAALMGVSKWKTPLDIWYRLVLQQPESKKETAFMQWGNLIEPIANQLLEAETGWEITPNDFLAKHPTLPVVATPDGFARDPFRDDPGVVELKAPSIYSADQWDEGVAPDFYVAQCKAEMLATGLEWGCLAAVLPPARGDDPLIYTMHVEWAPGEREHYEEVAKDWWRRHVELEEQPDAVDLDKDRLKALNADEELRTVLLDHELAERWARAAEAEKAAKRDLETTRAICMQRMGSAMYAVTPEGQAFSYRTNKAGARPLRKLKNLPAGAPAPDQE